MKSPLNHEKEVRVWEMSNDTLIVALLATLSSRLLAILELLTDISGLLLLFCCSRGICTGCVSSNTETQGTWCYKSTLTPHSRATLSTQEKLQEQMDSDSLEVHDHPAKIEYKRLSQCLKITKKPVSFSPWKSKKNRKI